MTQGPETKHTRYFRAHKCKPSETIHGSLDGWIGEMMGTGKNTQHNGALILTSERVAFVRKGFMGEVFQTIPIEKVTSIEARSFMGYRVITFHTSHDELSFKTFALADEFNALHEHVEKLRTELKVDKSAPDQETPLDQLKKLAALRDAGIVSEEEFASTKAELLRKI